MDKVYWNTLGPVIRSFLAAASAATLLSIVPAYAQTYPDKPIKIIVPFPAGGSIDLGPRIVGQRLGEILGQNVVIENRPGASGKIGVIAARDSAPDGYTFGLASAVTHGLAPVIIPNMGYDPVDDMTAVVWFTEYPNAFYVNSTIPVKTVQEFADLIKRNPGKYHYGSGGHGTANHVNAAIFLSTMGIDQNASNHIPYRGEAPAFADLIGGHVSYIIGTGSRDLVESGKMRILATTGRSRWIMYPEIPTTAEVGLPDVYYTGWTGLLAPKGTPKAVIDKINNATNQALKDPKIAKTLADNGQETRGGSPASFDEHIRAEATRWKTQVAKTGVNFSPPQ